MKFASTIGFALVYLSVTAHADWLQSYLTCQRAWKDMPGEHNSQIVTDYSDTGTKAHPSVYLLPNKSHPDFFVLPDGKLYKTPKLSEQDMTCIQLPGTSRYIKLSSFGFEAEMKEPCAYEGIPRADVDTGETARKAFRSALIQNISSISGFVRYDEGIPPLFKCKSALAKSDASDTPLLQAIDKALAEFEEQKHPTFKIKTTTASGKPLSEKFQKCIEAQKAALEIALKKYQAWPEFHYTNIEIRLEDKGPAMPVATWDSGLVLHVTPHWGGVRPVISSSQTNCEQVEPAQILGAFQQREADFAESARRDTERRKQDEETRSRREKAIRWEVDHGMRYSDGPQPYGEVHGLPQLRNDGAF